MNYALNHKKYFTNFLSDESIPLFKIAVKLMVITQRNSLFSDSSKVINASAIIFSIVTTATVNNLDAYKYLEYIFRQLPNVNFPSDYSVLEEYLSYADKV